MRPRELQYCPCEMPRADGPPVPCPIHGSIPDPGPDNDADPTDR